MNYIYPAFFYQEETGYSVLFPDFGGTCGDTLEEAYTMAKDYLYAVISGKTEDGERLPPPSKINEIKPATDFEYIAVIPMLIAVDIEDYEKYLDDQKKAVRKNVTIPKWLSELADRRHVSYSSVLQEALKRQLEL
jgi:predicted RNase H-like HicB family nuclease